MLFSPLTFAFTGFDPQQLSDLTDLVIANGGKVSQSLSTDVTHLIYRKVGSDKYFVARRIGTTTATLDWINDSIAANSLLPCHAYAPPLLGLRVCFTSLALEEDPFAPQLAAAAGATIDPAVSRELDLLVVPSSLSFGTSPLPPPPPRVASALSWQLPVGPPSYVYRLIEQSGCTLPATDLGANNPSKPFVAPTLYGPFQPLPPMESATVLFTSASSAPRSLPPPSALWPWLSPDSENKQVPISIPLVKPEPSAACSPRTPAPAAPDEPLAAPWGDVAARVARIGAAAGPLWVSPDGSASDVTLCGGLPAALALLGASVCPLAGGAATRATHIICNSEAPSSVAARVFEMAARLRVPRTRVVTPAWAALCVAQRRVVPSDHYPALWWAPAAAAPKQVPAPPAHVRAQEIRALARRQRSPSRTAAEAAGPPAKRAPVSPRALCASSLASSDDPHGPGGRSTEAVAVGGGIVLGSLPADKMTALQARRAARAAAAAGTAPNDRTAAASGSSDRSHSGSRSGDGSRRARALGGVHVVLGAAAARLLPRALAATTAALRVPLAGAHGAAAGALAHELGACVVAGDDLPAAARLRSQRCAARGAHAGGVVDLAALRGVPTRRHFGALGEDARRDVAIALRSHASALISALAADAAGSPAGAAGSPTAGAAAGRDVSPLPPTARLGQWASADASAVSGVRGAIGDALGALVVAWRAAVAAGAAAEWGGGALGPGPSGPAQAAVGSGALAPTLSAAGTSDPAAHEALRARAHDLAVAVVADGVCPCAACVASSSVLRTLAWGPTDPVAAVPQLTAPTASPSLCPSVWLVYPHDAEAAAAAAAAGGPATTIVAAAARSRAPATAAANTRTLRDGDPSGAIACVSRGALDACALRRAVVPPVACARDPTTAVAVPIHVCDAGSPRAAALPRTRVGGPPRAVALDLAAALDVETVAAAATAPTATRSAALTAALALVAAELRATHTAPIAKAIDATRMAAADGSAAPATRARAAPSLLAGLPKAGSTATKAARRGPQDAPAGGGATAITHVVMPPATAVCAALLRVHAAAAAAVTRAKAGAMGGGAARSGGSVMSSAEPADGRDGRLEAPGAGPLAADVPDAVAADVLTLDLMRVLREVDAAARAAHPDARLVRVSFVMETVSSGAVPPDEAHIYQSVSQDSRDGDGLDRLAAMHSQSRIRSSARPLAGAIVASATALAVGAPSTLSSRSSSSSGMDPLRAGRPRAASVASATPPPRSPVSSLGPLGVALPPPAVVPQPQPIDDRPSAGTVSTPASARAPGRDSDRSALPSPRDEVSSPTSHDSDVGGPGPLPMAGTTGQVAKRPRSADCGATLPPKRAARSDRGAAPLPPGEAAADADVDRAIDAIAVDMDGPPLRNPPAPGDPPAGGPATAPAAAGAATETVDTAMAAATREQSPPPPLRVADVEAIGIADPLRDIRRWLQATCAHVDDAAHATQPVPALTEAPAALAARVLGIVYVNRSVREDVVRALGGVIVPRSVYVAAAAAGKDHVVVDTGGGAGAAGGAAARTATRIAVWDVVAVCDAFTATPTTLSLAVSGCPLVRSAYIVRCEQAGRMIDPAPFELGRDVPGESPSASGDANDLLRAAVMWRLLDPDPNLTQQQRTPNNPLSQSAAEQRHRRRARPFAGMSVVLGCKNAPEWQRVLLAGGVAHVYLRAPPTAEGQQLGISASVDVVVVEKDAPRFGGTFPQMTPRDFLFEYFVRPAQRQAALLRNVDVVASQSPLPMYPAAAAV